MKLSGLHHGRCEDIFPQIEDGSLDAIVTDPPFNATEHAKSEEIIGGFLDRRGFQRHLGDWDVGFSPLYLVTQAARVLKKGGWLIVKSGDRTLGMWRDFMSRDHSTTKQYLDFLCEECIIRKDTHNWAIAGLDEVLPRVVPYFAYKATVAWHKKNPPNRVRKTTTCSSMEWIQIARRLDENGKSVKPVAWNFLSQRSMHNFFEGPLCGPPERLYWHILNPIYDPDNDKHLIGGEIVPCIQTRKCAICARFNTIPEKKRLPHEQRRRHPTQTPLYVWEWIYRRYTDPGLTIFDPYSGVGSSGIAARQHGLNWFGSEAEWEFVAVGNLWADGAWGKNYTLTKNKAEQLEMF